MKDCCGESRSTLFCPDCGRCLQDLEGLASLVKHCRLVARSKESGLRRFRARLQPQYIASWEQGIAKWHKWADDLEALINQ